MPQVPEHLDEGLHRELAGRRTEPWVRRGVLLVLVVILALGLANVFGQRASITDVSSAGAGLRMSAPTAARGGDIFEMRLEITAAGAPIEKPRVVLGRGWLEGITINTQSPADVAEEGTPNGGVVMSFDTVPAGQTLTVRMQLQVNPTTVSRREAVVVLRDGGRELTRVTRTLTIFP
jgi:hypothetical protein